MNLKTKIYIAVFLIILGLVCTISFQYDYIKKQKNNINRLEENLYIMDDNLNTFKYKDSLNGATIKSLIVTADEFKNMNSNTKTLIEDLNIKYKNLLKVNEIVIQQNQDLLLNKRIDTLFKADTIIKTVSASYRSPYFDLDILDLDNAYKINIESRDTIEQILTNIPKQFLFFKYGTKGFKTTIINKNPKSKIVFMKDYIFKNKVWKTL